MRRLFAVLCFALLTLCIMVSSHSTIVIAQLTDVPVQPGKTFEQSPDGVWANNLGHLIVKRGNVVYGFMSNVYGELCARGTVFGNSLATLGAAKMMYPIRTHKNSGELLSFEFEDLSPKNRAYEESESNPNKRAGFAIDRLVAVSPAEYINIQRSLVGNSRLNKERLFRIEKCFEYMESAGIATATGNGTAEAVPVEPKSLVVFFGGALDHKYNNMKQLADNYEVNMKLPSQTVKYFFHNASKTIPFAPVPEIRDDFEQFVVSELRKTPQLAIILIGHSWGGDTAYQVATRLSKANIDVALLVTIDPVSNARQWPKPANVQQWLNVYADMSIVNDCNRVADLGGQWKSQSAADFNQLADGLDHCHATDMFALVKDRAQKVMTSTQVNAEERKRILESTLFQQYVNGLGRTPTPGGRKRN